MCSEYLEVVRDSLATVGEDCNIAISIAHRELHVLLQQESGWKIISKEFRYMNDVYCLKIIAVFPSKLSAVAFTTQTLITVVFLFFSQSHSLSQFKDEGI